MEPPREERDGRTPFAWLFDLHLCLLDDFAPARNFVLRNSAASRGDHDGSEPALASISHVIRLECLDGFGIEPAMMAAEFARHEQHMHAVAS